MNIRTNILLRVYLAFGLIVIFAAAVVVQLCRVQFVQGKKWKAMADSMSTRYVNVEAARGNIFSVDGSLLATSVPEYELHMDMLAGGIAEDKVFYQKVDSLAMKLSQFFGDKSATYYSRMLRDARSDSSRYELIRRTVSYQDLKQIRKFPIFNMGKYKGGLIVVAKNKRILPFRSLAARTIGYKNENIKNPVGLEGAYSNYINGENGKRLMQRIAGNVWIPVNNDEEEEITAKDGSDIISTIDVNFQDVAERALKKQLIKSQADHGCVILMEVATGEIRAIANYTKVADGEYAEKLNYAISESAEPGSTFKLATYMTAIEQHKIDTNTLVDCEGGQTKLYNKIIRDSHLGNNVITVMTAFEKSSNVAAAKLIYQHYKDNPSQFTDQLYSYHLNDKLGLQIPGEGQPLIKTPKSKSWSPLSLPQIAYGYESKLTPLQTLTFYNAVANNGKMIAPLFVREIRNLGNTVEHFQARVINHKICSDVTLSKVKVMLNNVVEYGSGKTTVRSDLYKVAGKTGTAQVADGKLGYKNKVYQSSFCGYFPANHPKYSLIVVINKPLGAYYGAEVAGPVFRELADRVFARDLDVNQNSTLRLVGNTQMPKPKLGDRKAAAEVYTKLGIKPLYASNNAATTGVDTSNGIAMDDVKYKNGYVPDVTGMGLSDALYVLGNAGYKVGVRGSGTVTKQSAIGGSYMPKGTKILIELQ
ncbi:cell division protein [Mucilaginibacter sp. PPCGB 2223]|uniref:penicillin-binding protein n=1 Tax=Mucilaginibacter sp. PPCGB 2223 TaxID=1886027 RepID=UPI0008263C73|nr:penicillin-binding protein [Mucilaginibacter sp. PPCGB 2223]OCX51485.1 cell division protein [Mucilaginibacter sp. PPCGB 2223]